MYTHMRPIDALDAEVRAADEQALIDKALAYDGNPEGKYGHQLKTIILGLRLQLKRLNEASDAAFKSGANPEAIAIRADILRIKAILEEVKQAERADVARTHAKKRQEARDRAKKGQSPTWKIID